MKNYAQKVSRNHKDTEQKLRTNSKDKRQRKIPKIWEAFQNVKKLFNINVYNYESKDDESDVNVYSVITTHDSLSENNSNAFQHNRRTRRQTQESVGLLESAIQRNSPQIAEEQSNANAMAENKVAKQDCSNFEVTVFTTSEGSDKQKNARLKRQKPKTTNEPRKEKGEVKNKKAKQKPYFICYTCENIVPRAVGIKCQKLQCDEFQRCNQLFHSEEFLMIHKAKCQKGNETDDKDPSTSDETDESRYDEIDVEKKATPPPREKSKSCKKHISGKTKKRRSNRSSMASRFKDDIAAKIAKLMRRGTYSSTSRQKDNSNKHKPKHIPFEWLNDEECDITDTSMPSPCTISSKAHIYAVRVHDKRQKPEISKKKEPKLYELVQRKNKSNTNSFTNTLKPSTKPLNTGDSVSMTREQLVSMNFLCDHPNADEKRLAITNNIKLRVINSSAINEQVVENKKRIPWKPYEKQPANNYKQHPPKVSSLHREKEKRSTRHKEEGRQMRNVNNSESSVFRNDEMRPVCEKTFQTIDTNDNNRRTMPFPQTAPGKHFPHRTLEQPPLPLPVREEVRPNFRPPPFGCSHLQSQIPLQFRSSTKPPFLNDQCCQSSFTPTLYNYNHRQCLCPDTSSIPKLPWSIMARRMETFKRISDPPTLKYSYNGNSPTSSMERIQESRMADVPPLPPRVHQTALKTNQHSDGIRRYPGDVPRQFHHNTSAAVRNAHSLTEKRHLDVFNTQDQVATRRMTNFHRARRLAYNISQQFPGFMT